MSEKCPACAHNEALRINAESRQLAAQTLYIIYYRQCIAQTKGIKRLHRKIARLESRLINMNKERE